MGQLVFARSRIRDDLRVRRTPGDFTVNQDSSAWYIREISYCVGLAGGLLIVRACRADNRRNWPSSASCPMHIKSLSGKSKAASNYSVIIIAISEISGQCKYRDCSQWPILPAARYNLLLRTRPRFFTLFPTPGALPSFAPPRFTRVSNHLAVISHVRQSSRAINVSIHDKRRIN